MPDGIINVYKPVGITSAKAVYRVRKITGVRKSGHAGSLDPAAEGVLIVCQGGATKLVEQMMNLRKTYRAVGRLDVTSESFDSDRPLQTVNVAVIPSEAAVREAMTGFVGMIEQVPPRVSAIKLGGVPAYRTVGRADAPPMPTKQVRVYSLDLLRYDWPVVEFEMVCGRGTYVRSIIRDVGVCLGTGGCLTALRRMAVGPFLTEEAWTFERMEGATATSLFLIKPAEAVEMISRFATTESRLDTGT